MKQFVRNLASSVPVTYCPLTIAMILTIISLILGCFADDVVLIASEKTPFSVQALANQLPTNLSLNIVTVNSSSTDLGRTSWPPVVFDYSYSWGLSMRIAERTKGAQVVCMYELCPGRQGRKGLNAESTAEEIMRYLKTFNFTKGFLAVTATPFGQQVAKHLISQDFLTFPQVVYLRTGLSEVEVEQFVGRVLKPAGSTVAVLLVDEDTGSLLYPALQRFGLYKQGYAYFFSKEAVWGTRPEGALYMAESEAINATNRLEFEFLILQNLLTQMFPQTRLSDQYILPQEQVLVNIIAGKPVVLSSLSPVHFPGNTLTAPTLQKPIIEVSADFEGRNFDGSSYPFGIITTRGIEIGYREANVRSDLVPNYRFFPRSLHFGAMFFNLSWAEAQLDASWEHLGVVYHPFGFTTTIMRLSELFAKRNLTVPMTTISTGSALSDPVEFPLYLRTMSNNAASARIIIRFFQLFRWKRTAIIYSDETSQITFYQTFEQLAAESGISLTNNESLRLVPNNDSTQLNSTLQDIMSSTVRIIVIAHTQNYFIAERLYDLGARAGDYMICLYYGLSYTQYGGTDEASRKRRNVMRGAMMFYDRYFSGKEGPRVKQLLTQADGEKYDPVSCVYYDSVMLVAHAVDFMLARGLHFEHGNDLVRVMRNTRFNGCLGVIQIEPGSNDRSPGDYSVLNVHLEGANETLRLVDAAIYSPTRTQLFTLLPELHFPDGSTTGFPDSWVNDANCPYLVKEIKDFPSGVFLSLGLGLSFTALMGLFCLLLCQFCWKSRPTPLTTKIHMSIEDGLLMCVAFIEFLQLLAMGPVIALPEALESILAVISSTQEHVFWLYEVGTLVLVAVFIVLGIFKFAITNPKCWALSIIDSWSEVVLPFVGILCFVPIYHTMHRTFACFKSTGNEFTSSFLNDYCELHCWQGSHLKLVSTAALFLCLYAPLALFTKPLWQELHPNLHVKATSADLLSFSVLQMTLTVLRISLRPVYPLAQAVLYLVLITLYLLSSCYISPFNYARFTLWRQLMVVGNWVYGFIGLLSLIMEDIRPMRWSIVLGISWSVILLLGLLIQSLVRKYRCLLIRDKEDRTDIIRFAFTFGVLSTQYLARFRGRARTMYMVRAAATEKVVPSRVPNTTVGELVDSHNSA